MLDEFANVALPDDYCSLLSTMRSREIMMPDEVRKMDNKKCLLFIRAFNPVLDDKYKTAMHPMFSQSADGNGNAYVHSSLEDNADKEPSFMLLNQKALEYYEGLKSKGESVYIDTIPYEDFMLLN